ncbi:MAG: hypothetical protein ACLTT1_01725 [[Clostridium] scindens]
MPCDYSPQIDAYQRDRGKLPRHVGGIAGYEPQVRKNPERSWAGKDWIVSAPQNAHG